MNIDELYEKYQQARETENIDKICECILESLKLREEISKTTATKLPEKLIEILSRGDILFYRTLQMIEVGDSKRAIYYLNPLLNSLAPLSTDFFYLLYILGRVCYIGGNYQKAIRFFSQYDEWRFSYWQDVDELSLFYRGNCAVLEENFSDAMKFYEQALEIKSDFPEVQNNLEVIKSNNNDNLIMELSSLWTPCAWQDVPIFINARDRIGVMKKLIDWLLDAGYRNLIILDNNSTYPKLLTYYSELEKDSRVKIILLGKNLGYKALWKSGILEKLKISTPYVYTDPDVVPDKNCPKNLVEKLFEILNSHHEIRKVAPMMVWEDITFFGKERQQLSEITSSQHGYIGNNLCYANADTTFALHSNTRNYTLRFAALRTLGDMRMRHLPWYFDYDNLPEDEKYYMDHADKNSITTVKR